MSRANAERDKGYSVKIIENCTVVFGSIPLNDFGKLCKAATKESVLDAGIADRIGATLVAGKPDDLERLRARKLPVSEKRRNEARAAEVKGLGSGVINWLLDGERGESSNAMCKCLFGIPEDADESHPYDPDDLSRCLSFLAATTSAGDKLGTIGKMRALSPQWVRLVDRWEAIESAYQAEMGQDKRKTYALMREALEPARAPQPA